MVLEKPDIENWMKMRLFKNKMIEERQWDYKIEELISHFSEQISKGEMKFNPGVRVLEEYIIKNIHIFTDTREDWLRRKKSKKKNHQIKKILQTRLQNNQPQYIFDGINYYNSAREKFEHEQLKKLERMKEKFNETRQFTSH